MSWLDDLFFKKDDYKNAPRTKESQQGGQFLMDILNQGSPDYPQRKIAGLSDNEQAIQGNIASFLNANQPVFQSATDEIMATLSGDYDPRTSDFYKGVRQEADILKEEESDAIRRRANLGGMLYSTGASNIEAKNNARIDAETLQVLGSLTENERNRKLGTAMNASQNAVANTLAAQGVSAVPRQVTQEEYDAMYAETLDELLAPYQLMSPIATSMMGYSPGIINYGGGLTGLGFLTSAGANVAAAYAGKGG
jgi:hypothetical protein